MMSSPEEYIEFRKNKSYAELVEEKNKLIAEIKRFENGEIHTGTRVMNPTPEVIYQCNLEYLSVLCKMIVDKYRDEYVWAYLNDDDEDYEEDDE